MALEIEHRYLVQPSRLPEHLPKGDRLDQGFLSLEPVVRVRIVTPPKDKAYARLTVKGRGLRVRQEFEYSIPLADARAMLALCGTRIISKIRMRVGPWEIDQYLGRHEGLWTAEIELPSLRAKLPQPLPEWLGREVTEDPRFTNARLATMKRWHPKALR